MAFSRSSGGWLVAVLMSSAAHLLLAALVFVATRPARLPGTGTLNPA